MQLKYSYFSILPVFGCLLSTSSLMADSHDKRVAVMPNFAEHIAPIIQQRCEGCHREGEVAPFALQSFEQTKKWSNSLVKATRSGYMPPWKPTPGYGNLAEEHRLMMPKTEVALLAKWVDGGMPAGDMKLAPKPKKYTPGWSLGKPDMVLAPTKAYQLASEGSDVYRHFVVDPHFTELPVPSGHVQGVGKS